MTLTVTLTAEQWDVVTDALADALEEVDAGRWADDGTRCDALAGVYNTIQAELSVLPA